MNKNIEFNEIIEVTDDEGSIHLLLNIKYKVIERDTVYPIQNMTYSKSLVLCATIVRHPQ